MNELGLGMVFSAKDLATNVMGRVAQQMTNLEGKSSMAGQAIQKNFAQFNLGMRTMGAGVGLLEGAVSLANISGTFNKELAGVGAIAGASAADMKVLHDAAIEAGIATQFSPKEAAEGLGQLAQAGYNATEATSLLVPTLDLAAGGQISVAQAAATTSAAVKIFGLSMDDAALATDKLLRISNATSLTAGDLQLALGNVARGAVATGQSLDEMLPAMGLVKNTGVQASVAASSVSSALLMVAKNAGKFKSDLGVEVTDAAGNFRPLMDIVLETDASLRKKLPNAAERSAKAMELFGKFGLTAFSGISAQLTGGITGSGGQKLFGAEAVADLRNRMAQAEGAAAEFREKLLDTFEGQKTLFAGSIETMAILLGEPFERALKPVVKFVLEQFNKVLGFVKSLPDGVKDFIAQLVLGAGAVLTVVGGLIALKASLAMAAWGMSALGITVGGVLSTMLPAVLVVGALVGAIAAIKYAVDNNLGGVGDRFNAVVSNVLLFKDALAQLFEQGGLSGDMLSAYFGGEGAVNFAIRVYVVFNRLWEFFSAFGSGVLEVFETMDGSINRLGDAFESIGKSLGFLTDEADVEGNAAAFAEWGQAGFKAGEFIGNAIDTVINIIAAGLEVVGGFIDNFGEISDAAAEFKPIFEDVGNLIMDVLNDFGLLDAGAEDSTSTFRKVGAAIAGIVGTMVRIVAWAVRNVVDLFTGLSTYLSGVVDVIAGLINGDMGRVWQGMKKQISGILQVVLATFGPIIDVIASAIDSLFSLAGMSGSSFAKNAKEIRASMRDSLKDWAGYGTGVAPMTGEKVPAPQKETMPKDLVDFYTLPESPYAPTYDNVARAEAEAGAKQQVDVEGLNASIADMKAAKSGDVMMSGNVVLNDDIVGTMTASADSAARASGRPAPTRG